MLMVTTHFRLNIDHGASLPKYLKFESKPGQQIPSERLDGVLHSFQKNARIVPRNESCS
jgi:hypothetical protein